MRVAKGRYRHVMSLLSDFTARYSSSEAWLYDRFIAPAVMDMGETVVDDYLRLLREGAEVLEVGCGRGQFARSTLDQRGDLRWIGLDVSAVQIARARQRNANHESAALVVGDALELPFPDERFDALGSGPAGGNACDPDARRAPKAARLMHEHHSCFA